MKIIFALASLGSGGAERVVTLLANRMDEMGHQIEIVCLKYDDVYYQTNEGVKVVLAEHLGHSLPELFWLRKHIRQEKPDVVIAFTEGVYCFTIAALLGIKIPIIASERLDPSAMTWKRNLLKRILLPYADWLVVQTKAIKDYFPNSIQKKTSVIYNPVSLTPTLTRREEETYRIISVARLFPQKNQEMMIRAFAQIADEFLKWQLVIFGEGPRRQSLQLIIDNLQLSDRIKLSGRTEHVSDELRKSKIFCLSSDYEGMSNSMIEAICVGLPIVTTKVSGTDELVQKGINGYVVEIGDVEGMACALKKLMSDEHLMRQMGENSLKMKPQFQLDTILEEWITLIKKLIR